MAFLMVPAVYFSVNLWRTLHQGPTIRPDGVTMDPEMLRAFLFNLAAFSILFAAMLVSRVRLQFAIEDAESASPGRDATLSQPNLEML